MNVLEALTGVIPMQLATILKEVTPALVTLDILAMDIHVQVSAGMCYHYRSHSFSLHTQ